MQHLDEGTIHAWLDGQLPSDEALEVEAHVAECRPCADAVAEARGLVAASSRILMALDDVPREVVPKAPPSHADFELSAAAATPNAAQSPAQRRASRRWFRGGSLAAAAAIVVAIGTVAVMRAKDQRLASLASDVEVANSRVAGPAVDSPRSVVPSAASAPTSISAATPAATALGAGSGGAKERDAAPPSSAPAGREKASANEFRRAPEEAVRPGQRAEEQKKTLLEKRQLADAASNAEPAAVQATVQQRGQVAASNKPTDEVGKDKKQELQAPARRDGFARDSRASSDSGSLDRLRAQETAAPAAKVAAFGGVRGRVVDANNTGLSAAMVTVVGTTTGGLTNDVGEFTLGGLPAGPHQISVRLVGYNAVTRDVTVAAGQTVASETIVLSPSPVTLSAVAPTAVAGAAVAQRDRAKPAAPSPAPAGRAEGAAQAPANALSTAAGCYDLSITPTSSPSRTGFRQMPRSIALDSDVATASTPGVWYRARDLATSGALPNGVWRPTGPESFELTWTYGSRSAQIYLSGPAGSMLRGTIQEIDRATATGEAGAVVTIRRACR